MGKLSVSAATVTQNSEGKVLLIKRADNGQWQIPGGVVELGEQPVDAGIRETREETGIDIADLCLTGCYTNVKRGIVAMVFTATPTGGEPTISDESVDVRFVSVEEAIACVPEIFKYRLLDALHYDGRVKFRSHDGEKWCSGEDL